MNSPLISALSMLRFCFLFFFCFFLYSSAYGEHRVALVIGNQSYKAGPLRNPINDARAMSEMLKSKLGFEVIELHDVGLGEMTQQLRQFVNKVKDGAVALVYFAGHGAQYEEKNYLFPVDFKGDFTEDLPYTALPLQRVLDKLNRKNKNGANLVLLDACRNNPLMSKDRSYMRGLAEVKLRPNSYVAYATLPNGVASDNPQASNGLFTQSLLKHMSVSGTNLDTMIRRVRNDVHRISGGRQIPYGINLLKEEFCFNGCQASNSKKVTPKQSSKTFIEIETLANQGDKKAQGRLSRMLEEGTGVEKNLKQSLMWLKRAATNGNREAQSVLGGYYQDGKLGLTIDYKKAFNWYQLSAKKEYDPAQFLLARLLQKGGYGIKRNHELASYWFEKSASHQNIGAQLMLGLNYCKGQGVPKNFKSCATWVSKGFNNADAEEQDKDFARAIWKKFDLNKYHTRLDRS